MRYKYGCDVQVFVCTIDEKGNLRTTFFFVQLQVMELNDTIKITVTQTTIPQISGSHTFISVLLLKYGVA